MSHLNKIVTIIFALIISSPYASSAATSDAFSKCMARTQRQRLVCTSGCGMIIQGCYDEGVDDVSEKIEHKLQSNKGECVDLLTRYQKESIDFEGKVIDEAKQRPGWIGAELKLYLVQQRLAALQFIEKSCNRNDAK